MLTDHTRLEPGSRSAPRLARHRFAILAVMLVLAACGEESPATPSNTTGARDPVTVTADNGKVTLDRIPGAIISLSPTLTEMLFAVGAGDQVIAVDSASNHPDQAPVTELSGFRPNVEAIGALEPDLVVISRDRDGVVAKLDEVGIPVVVLESASDLEDVYRQIQVVGALTGHADNAAALVSRMRTEIDELVASVPSDGPPLTYFYELSSDYHTLTSDTFVGAIMTMLGLENIADGVDPAAGGFPQLGAEYVLGADPDLVFWLTPTGLCPQPTT